MRSVTITAAELLAMILKADSERHPNEQAWIDEELGLNDVCLDGRFDLERIAELLSQNNSDY